MTRVLAELTYSTGPVFAPTVAIGAAPPFLDGFQTRAVAPAGGSGGSTTMRTYGSYAESNWGFTDFSGDGIPDLFSAETGETWWHRIDHLDDPSNPSTSSVAAVEDDDHWFEDHTAAGRGLGNIIPPLVESGPCSSTQSGRYGRVIHQDIDGDGWLDAVESSAVPAFLEADYGTGSVFIADHCPTNEALGGVTWTVHWGERGGISTSTYSFTSPPAAYPSMGAVQRITPPPDGYPNPLDPSDLALGKETIDGRVEMMDMNGDGWVDIVTAVANVIIVYPHNTGRSQGWGSPVIWGSDSAFEGLTRTVAWTDGGRIDDRGIDEYELSKTLETLTVAGLRDLNGDGLPDFVEACAESEGDHDEYWWCGSDEAASVQGPPGATGVASPSSWTVWFNDGTGFLPPTAWSLPAAAGFDDRVVGLSQIDEGEALSRVCMVGEADYIDLSTHIADMQPVQGGGEKKFGVVPQLPGGSTPPCTDNEFAPEYPAAPQRVMANLVDYDADGRVDYVDADARRWFRNLGDGFDVGRDLPNWFPSALSEVMTHTISGNDPTAPPQYSFALPFPQEMVQQQHLRVEDLNNDGVLDIAIDAEEGETLQYTPTGGRLGGEITSGGLYFGAFPPPGHLVRVEVETGATTVIEYGPASEEFPAGEDKSGHPQERRVGGAVVKTITTTDTVDPDNVAQQRFWYRDGVCEFGDCFGFDTHVERTYKLTPDLVQAGVSEPVLVSSRITENSLSRDIQVPVRSSIYRDRLLVHMNPSGGQTPELAIASRVDSNWRRRYDNTNTTATSVAGEVLYPRLKNRFVYDYADDGAQSRGFKVTPTFNNVGLPTQVVHADLQDNTNNVRVHTDWRNNGADVWRPVRQWTRSYHTGSWVTIEMGWFYWDGGGYLGSPTDGLLTGQTVCADENGNSLCSDQLYWDFSRTLRGTVDEVYVTDGPLTFGERTVNQFGWGETVALDEENGLGHTTLRTIDDMGRVVGERDPNGLWARTDFDTFGRPETEYRDAPGHSQVVTREWSYDTSAVPNTTSETVFGRSPTGQVESRHVHQILNGFGDVVQTYTPHPWGAGYFLVTDAHYDAFGNHLKTSETYGAKSFAPTLPLQWEADMVMEAEYDGLGMERRRWTDAGGEVTTELPFAGVSQTQDASDYYKQLVTDTHGNIIQVFEGQTDPGTLVVTGEYDYDARGRMVKFEDGNGNRHLYEYDAAGRLRRVFRQGYAATSGVPYVAYTYEGPWVQTMHEGTVNDPAVVEWDYDALGRTTEKRILTDGSMKPYTWEWDGTGATAWIGVRHKTTDPAGETRYFYDEVAPWGSLGRLTTVERDNSPGTTMTFEYEYDFEGRSS